MTYAGKHNLKSSLLLFIKESGKYCPVSVESESMVSSSFGAPLAARVAAALQGLPPATHLPGVVLKGTCLLVPQPNRPQGWCPQLDWRKPIHTPSTPHPPTYLPPPPTCLTHHPPFHLPTHPPSTAPSLQPPSACPCVCPPLRTISSFVSFLIIST